MNPLDPGVNQPQTHRHDTHASGNPEHATHYGSSFPPASPGIATHQKSPRETGGQILDTYSGTTATMIDTGCSDG